MEHDGSMQKNKCNYSKQGAFVSALQIQSLGVKRPSKIKHCIAHSLGMKQKLCGLDVQNELGH